MAYYSYKQVLELLPPHIIEAMGPDYTGSADYDGEQWIAAANYIKELLSEVHSLKAELELLKNNT